jgi:hypothetical protein
MHPDHARETEVLSWSESALQHNQLESAWCTDPERLSKMQAEQFSQF